MTSQNRAAKETIPLAKACPFGCRSGQALSEVERDAKNAKSKGLERQFFLVIFVAL